MRLTLTLIFLALVAIMLTGCGKNFEFAIPRDKLDPRVQAKFPLSKGGLLKITLTNPEIEYLASKNRLRVDVNVEVRALGILPARGTAQVEGGLAYNAKRRAIVMTDIEVHKLNIKGLPDGKHEEVIGLIGQAVRPVLNQMELYQFDSNSRIESIAGAHLKGFRVEKDRLIVIISPTKS
ncbi:MAG: DUF1439 domain-containing protein [Candidatus Methylacidiphilales bacterium]